MRALATVLVAVLFAPVASAGVLGASSWDARELVRLAGTQGPNLLADAAFSRVPEEWLVSFTDVGGGDVEADDGTLRMRAVAGASGAAYAEARVPVEPGRAYHFAVEARLLGNASEVACLVLGGGAELVVRGDPRANAWGIGGTWTAPAGTTEARVLLRFLLVEGMEGGAEFRAPFFGEGAAPVVRVDGSASWGVLARGAHDVAAGGSRATLDLRSLPPRFEVEGPRFVPVGVAPEFRVTATDPDAPQLLPNPTFDPFRGWWSLSDAASATLRLAPGDARLSVPPAAAPRNLSVAGVLEPVVGESWRFALDATLPRGASGYVFLRERGFPVAAGAEPWADSGAPIEGEGPWAFEATRREARSTRLEVILVFSFPAGVGGDVALRSASLTPALRLSPLERVVSPPHASPGLASLPLLAEDATRASIRATHEHWVGAAPVRCAGAPPRFAWPAPGDASFAWRLPDGAEVPVDASPAIDAEGDATLRRGNETWWTPPAEASVPTVEVAQGRRVAVALPCARGAVSGPAGVEATASGVRVAWWRLPGEATLHDEDGRPVARVVVAAPSGALGVAALAAVALLLLAWRLRRR